MSHNISFATLCIYHQLQQCDGSVVIPTAVISIYNIKCSVYDLIDWHAQATTAENVLPWPLRYCPDIDLLFHSSYLIYFSRKFDLLFTLFIC